MNFFGHYPKSDSGANIYINCMLTQQFENLESIRKFMRIANTKAEILIYISRLRASRFAIVQEGCGIHTYNIHRTFTSTKLVEHLKCPLETRTHLPTATWPTIYRLLFRLSNEQLPSLTSYRI